MQGPSHARPADLLLAPTRARAREGATLEEALDDLIAAGVLVEEPEEAER
jgi:hypothetical protein